MKETPTFRLFEMLSTGTVDFSLPICYCRGSFSYPEAHKVMPKVTCGQSRRNHGPSLFVHAFAVLSSMPCVLFEAFISASELVFNHWTSPGLTFRNS